MGDEGVRCGCREDARLSRRVVSKSRDSRYHFVVFFLQSERQLKSILSRALALLFASSVVLACTSQPPRYPPPAFTEIAATLVGYTVALYPMDAEAPRCTGVWVGPHRILTAGHCVVEDELNPLFYSTAEEYIGVLVQPRGRHSMKLVKRDEKHDLALYETGVFDTPMHTTALLAQESPAVGSSLHFMGHTRGLSWSYKHGWVSFYREVGLAEDIGKEGPWMQVSAPISNGDSGGGAYNDRGELVGTSSYMVSGVPSNGFYTTVATLRRFL